MGRKKSDRRYDPGQAEEEALPVIKFGAEGRAVIT
jgi:hypothetical protein